MADLLIKDGFIVTMDDNKSVYGRGSVYIQDGRIAEIGERIKLSHTPEEVIDAKNKVILPGFVNTHAHLQQYFRGFYELLGEFTRVNLPLETYRQPEDMNYLGLASCAEFIYAGCTTALVTYTYPDGFAQVVEQAGNRVFLGADIEEVDMEELKQGVYQYLPEKGEEGFQRAVDFHQKWHGKANGRITAVMSPKAPDMVRPEIYEQCKEYAVQNQLRLSTHLSQSSQEYYQVQRLYGKTPPQHLHSLGILDNQLIAAHCAYATDEDIRLIAEMGTSILQCRFLQSPFLRWKDMGIGIGLGTDDYFHDMLQLMRENIAGQGFRAGVLVGAEQMLAADRVTARPEFYEMLELATIGGARVLGIDDQVGSLEVGKKADIITINMSNPFLLPTMDPVTSIVLYGQSADIDNVLVDGNFLKRDGKFTTIEIDTALEIAQVYAATYKERYFKEHPEQQQIWARKVPYMD